MIVLDPRSQYCVEYVKAVWQVNVKLVRVGLTRCVVVCKRWRLIINRRP